MPDCSDNYESEISYGRNGRNIKCKFCDSLILTPATATFTSFEFQLPLIKQTKTNQSNLDPETETVSLFWTVNDMFVFHNVGFSNSVGNNKYLACADCEAGPIGYYDLTKKKSYVALSRVHYSNAS